MSEIHAVILLSQLKKLNIILSRLKRNHKKIEKVFKNLIKNKYIKSDLLEKNSSSNYAFFVFRIIKKKKFVLDFIKKQGFKYVTSTNTYDSHNFNVWKKFLIKNKYQFKNSARNNIFIKNSFYIEVNSK